MIAPVAELAPPDPLAGAVESATGVSLPFGAAAIGVAGDCAAVGGTEAEEVGTGDPVADLGAGSDRFPGFD